MNKTVMLVAGEASGDMYGAQLAHQLQTQQQGIHCIGMGGRHMREAGVELIVDSTNIAVVGLFEVLAHWSEIQTALKTLQQTLAARKPDLLVLIDYPEFNLKLAQTAKVLGIQVLFYVSPQVWAWRPKRIHKIGQRIDHMAVIFPFEVDLYRQAGIPVTYVGHPLTQRVKVTMPREALFNKYALNPELKTVALMPGSRHSEIQRLLPVLIATAKRLRHHLNGGVQFVLPVAPNLDIAELKAKIIDTDNVHIHAIQDQTYNLVNASDIAITASGTATLETALLHTPMIVIYKVSPLSHAILKRLIRIKHISLVNIIADKEIVPELLQAKANVDNITAEALRQLGDADYYRRIKNDLAAVKQNLGKLDGIVEMGNLILKMLCETHTYDIRKKKSSYPPPFRNSCP